MLQGDATEQTPPDLPSFLFKERIVYLVTNTFTSEAVQSSRPLIEVEVLCMSTDIFGKYIEYTYHRSAVRWPWGKGWGTSCQAKRQDEKAYSAVLHDLSGSYMHQNAQQRSIGFQIQDFYVLGM